MSRLKRLAAAMAVVVLIGAAFTAGAAPITIAEANFTGMSATNVTTVNPVNGANDFTWTGPASGLDIVTDTSGINSGGARRIDTTSGTWQTLIGTMASSTTLTVGQTLTLTFTGRYYESPANNSVGLRFGFINSDSLDNNFLAQMGTGGSTGFALARDSGPVGGDASPGSGANVAVLTSTASGTTYASLATSPYSAVFSITKNASDYTVMADVNGSIRTATSSVGWDSYNAIFIRNGNIAADFLVDNVVVSVIPEPGSGLMLMAAAAGIGLLRRRLHG